MKWLAMKALVLASTMACAADDALSVPNNPKWKEECSSCHVAYPPQLLTADNWQRVMEGLEKHFGQNAGLEPKAAKEILDFLQDNSGLAWGGKSSESGLRITDTSWFNRKHRRVSNKIWFDAAVKSPSNCTACHIYAESGDWSKEGVFIPMPGGDNVARRAAFERSR